MASKRAIVLELMADGNPRNAKEIGRTYNWTTTQAASALFAGYQRGDFERVSEGTYQLVGEPVTTGPKIELGSLFELIGTDSDQMPIIRSLDDHRLYRITAV